MTLSYGGSLTLGQCIPLALQANAELDASIAVSLPDVQARVTGLLSVSIQPPPSLPQLIADVTSLLASLQGLLAAPLPDVAATAAALAELQATLAQLTASLGFANGFGALLAQAGIYYYVYAGRADQLGPEVTSALAAGLPSGAPGEQIAGALLLARDAGAISALRAVLRS
jgi:hypothetical protein